MKTAQTFLLSTLAILVAGGAYAAPEPGPQAAQGTMILSGESAAVGPRFSAQQSRQQPTPLFTFGGLAVGIWTPVPPPYNASANRNLAANPLP